MRSPWREEGLGPQTEASSLCIINHRSQGKPIVKFVQLASPPEPGRCRRCEGAFWALGVDYMPANKEPTALQIHRLGVLP